MLVSAINEILHFINVSVTDPVAINSYQCEAEIYGMEVSYNDEFIFCLQRGTYPVVLNISDLDNIKVFDRINSLPSIFVAKFRRTQKGIIFATRLSAVATYSIELKTMTKVRTLPSSITCICMNNADNRLLVACTNKTILICEPNVLEQLQVYNIESPVIAMAFDPNDDNFCGIHHEKSMLSLYDFENNKFLFKRKVQGLKDFRFVPKHHFLVSIGEGYRCTMHDLKNHKYIFKHNLPIKSKCIASVENFIAIGGEDGTIILFDMFKYAFPLKQLPGDGDRVQSLCFYNNANIFNALKNSEEENKPAGDDNDNCKAEKVDAKPNGYCLMRKKDKRIIKTNEIIISENTEEFLEEMTHEIVSYAKQHVVNTLGRVTRQLEIFEGFVNTEMRQIKELNENAWKDVMSKVADLDPNKTEETPEPAEDKTNVSADDDEILRLT